MYISEIYCKQFALTTGIEWDLLPLTHSYTSKKCSLEFNPALCHVVDSEYSKFGHLPVSMRPSKSVPSRQAVLKSLGTLILRDQAISEVDWCFLKDFENLQVLDLCANSLSTMYVNSRNLVCINISGNRFTEIPCLTNLNSLLHLNISYNNLNRLNITSLPKQLKSLDSAFNDIESMELTIGLKQFTKLKLLWFLGNPIALATGYKTFYTSNLEFLTLDPGSPDPASPSSELETAKFSIYFGNLFGIEDCKKPESSKCDFQYSLKLFTHTTEPKIANTDGTIVFQSLEVIALPCDKKLRDLLMEPVLVECYRHTMASDQSHPNSAKKSKPTDKPKKAKEDPSKLVCVSKEVYFDILIDLSPFLYGTTEIIYQPTIIHPESSTSIGRPSSGPSQNSGITFELAIFLNPPVSSRELTSEIFTEEFKKDIILTPKPKARIISAKKRNKK